MPLTFAHPAIVLPLNKLTSRWFSLTGLIVGSVVPDFEYFIRMRVYSIYSHTWLGLLSFDLPLGLLLTFVYHDIVRDKLIQNMPLPLYQRLSIFKQFNWDGYCKQHWFKVVISILVGAASHLFWDSFTHINGYFVAQYGMTKTTLVFGHQLPIYKVIQHASTLVGGVAIITALWRLAVMPASRIKTTYPYWLSVVAIAMIVLVLRIALGLHIKAYFDLLVTALSGLLIAVTIVPLAGQRWFKSLN